MLTLADQVSDLDRKAREIKRFAHQEANWIDPVAGQRPGYRHKLRWGGADVPGTSLTFTYAVEATRIGTIRHLSILFTVADQLTREEAEPVMQKMNEVMQPAWTPFFPLHNEVAVRWDVLPPVTIPLRGSDPERPAVVYRTPLVFHVVAPHRDVPALLAEMRPEDWKAQAEHDEEMLIGAWARIDELEEELRSLRQGA